MSESARFSVYCDSAIVETAGFLAKEAGYPSRSAYVQALIQADALGTIDHRFPKAIAKQPLLHQDRLNAEILKQTIAAIAPPDA